MSAPPNPPEPTIRYFGDYLLLGEIAAGGMGVVYSAQQVSLNRAVAVKLIRAGTMATESERQRFRTEAEAAAKLDHPHIVPIYEIGAHEGQPFVSMKLIDGDSLADRLARDAGQGRFDGRTAATVLAKVARAVHHAHERGVLHRDIKPANILIDAKGEPHLTDFGLAKLLERDSSYSLTGVILGTPGYISPEQAAGRIRQITAASDVYSLGAVFYALLTGRPPFHGESAAAMLDQAQKLDPPRPRSLHSAIDSDLETICLKCLEKDPGDRYATAAALADELDRWIRDEPILTRPVPSWERLGKWTRRNPVVAGLAAIILVGGLLSLLTGLWLWQRAADRNAAGAGVARTLSWKSVTAPAEQAQPNTGYYVETATQVSITLPDAPATGDVIRVVGVGAGGWRLEQNTNQVIHTELFGVGSAGWAWAPQSSGDRQWVDLACSADGTRVVAAEFGYHSKRGRGGWIYTSSDRGQTWIQRGPKRPWTAVTCSADGEKLLAASYMGPLSLSRDGGLTWNDRTPTNHVWTSVASSGDGARLVAVDSGGTTNGGRIYVSIDEGQTWTPRENSRHWYDVAMSPDGMKIAALEGHADFDGSNVVGFIYTSVDGGTNWAARLTDQERRWISIAMSADGRRLIAAMSIGQIFLSEDGGENWRANLDDEGLGRMWLSVASDSRAETLVALAVPRSEARASGALFVSHDAGKTWAPREAGRIWRAAAASKDGHLLFAAVGSHELDLGSFIYTSARTTTPGAAGLFAGAPGSEVELQYIGRDQFRILKASGTLFIEQATVDAGKRPGNLGRAVGWALAGCGLLLVAAILRAMIRFFQNARKKAVV